MPAFGNSLARHARILYGCAMADSIKVGIIEDDRVFRGGIQMLLEGTDGFRCVGCWGSVEMALVSRSPDAPDVILLDIGLPGTAGHQGVQSILERWPEGIVIMFTASSDDDKIFASLCRGASGYLLKGIPPAPLLDAISEAAAGGSPMSPQIARKVVQTLQQGGVPRSRESPLTPRETQILSLLADGQTYQTAARQLEISINTVRNHIRSIYRKLQVHSQGEAVSKALRSRLI